MNKNLFFTLFFLLSALVGLNAQIVNIPDANFKNALVNTPCAITTLIGPGAGAKDVDENDDGEIQVSEAQAVEVLTVNGHAIQSLEGIESFSQLGRLECHSNLLTSLNVEGLNNLNWLNCYNNQLTTLELQGLVYLRGLTCNNNQLITLNLQGLANMRYLHCANNQLTMLNLQGLDNLINVHCETNQLSTLNVQGAVNLDYLSCSNNQLTTLEVQGLINLTSLHCNDNQLTSLDVQGLDTLGTLYCQNNQLSALNLQGANNLKYLSCNTNQLITLEMTGLENLTVLYCDDNQLTTLQLQELINLQSVSCSYNQLTVLDVLELTNLEGLACDNNQLTTLDVQGQSNLGYLNCSSNQLTTLYLKNGGLESSLDFSDNPNLAYICCDPGEISYVYDLTLQNEQVNCSVQSSCSSINTFLQGSITSDQNLNCLNDGDELGLQKRLIKAEKAGLEPFFTISNNDGDFLMGLDTGLYKVSTYLLNNYSLPCVDSVWVNVPEINDSVTVDIPLQPVISCPLLEVNIAAAQMRRCFNNQYIVQYCNVGTAPAPNAQVTVTLSEDVNFINSSIPGINVGGNDWQFSVGEVHPDDCGSFVLVFHVNCETTVLGQTICASAHITPDSICTPAGSDWSGAEVMVNGYCEGDSVRFTIQNIGYGDMTQDQEYIVIEDDVILMLEPFNLDAGQSLEVALPANGSSWRMEAGQEPTFPFVSMPSASVEGCGLNLGGFFSLGFVTQFSEQDGNPFFSRDCREVVGSYDPNEKLAQPRGVGEAHYIYPETDIEYQISFQNTGTDTAFTVAIRDTLQQDLDLTTFRAGISSHPYEVEILGTNILKFTFNHILLPDSNINEVASHGFVRFRIQPKDTIALGTRIENRAGIYFDFNAPVITNTVFHTVDTGFLERKLVSVHTPRQFENVQLFPNPVRAGAYLYSEYLEVGSRITLRDPLGKEMVQMENSDRGKLRIPEGMTAGMYFLEWSGESGVVRWGKVVVE